MPDREKDRQGQTPHLWPSVTTLMQRWKWRESRDTDIGRDPNIPIKWSFIFTESIEMGGAKTNTAGKITL